MADPTVIQNIKRAAAATGADPAAMLATSLVEDGARPGIIGDNGTSEGPFQFHEGGALPAGKPLSWGDSYAAYLNRAQEFKRLQVHGGKGAAAIQRPADPSGYAAKVQGEFGQARQLLGEAAPVAPATGQPQASAVIPGNQLLASLLPGIQSALNSNSDIAGVAPITLPLTAPQPTPTTAPKATTPGLAPVVPGTRGKVIAGAAKIIGSPYQGTHAVAFNKAGGSNNWESENAVDIAMPKGTPIYAPTSGVIGSQIGSLGAGGRFAGLRVHLAGGGQQFYFAHLSKLAVKAGQKVQAGQIIGYSGEANGVQHLHLAVVKGNPARYA